MSPPTATRRRLRAGAALAMMLGYAAGVPALLWWSAGWPLPRQLPDMAQVGDALTGGWRPEITVVAKVFALVAWVLWAQIGLGVAAEVRSRLSGRRPVQIGVPGFARPLVVRLAAAVVTLAPTLGVRPAGAAMPVPPPAVTVVVSPSPAVETTSTPAPVAAGSPSAAATVRYVVRPGDNLWDLAADQLGDPLRWREVFELNRGRPQPDGRSLDEPSLLRPGWTLRLPVPSSAPGTNSHPQPEPAPVTETSAPEVSPAPTAPPVSPVPTPVLAPPAPVGAEFRNGSDEAERSQTEPAALQVAVPSLVAGAVIGYLGALRRGRQRWRRRHHRFSPSPAPLATVERQVRAIASTDAPTWVDGALRHLAASLSEEGAPPPPGIVAVRAGSFGIEVLLTRPWPVAPGRFLPVDDGHTWRLDPDVELDELSDLARAFPSYVSALATVGESDAGAVLVDLDQLGAMAVDGDAERVAAVLGSIALELATAPWADLVDLCLVGGSEFPFAGLEILERVRVLDGGTALTDLTACAGPAAMGGLAAAAAHDLPPGPTVAVIWPGAMSLDELDELVALAQPHTGLALVIGEPGASTLWRLTLTPSGDGMLAPLDLALRAATTPATTDGLARLLVEAAARHTDVPVQVDAATAEPPAQPVVSSTQPEALAGSNGPDARDADGAPGPGACDDDGRSIVLGRLAGDPAHTENAVEVFPHGTTVVRLADETMASAKGDPQTSEAGALTDPGHQTEPLRAGGRLAEVRVLGRVEVTWLGQAPPRPQMAELVAYLATHRPAVSGERIRLALWPASTDDERFGERSSRTLWALTTRARQALGRDGDGESLLQRDEHNTLALSPLVGCDWADFQALVAAARTDPGRAGEHLTQALSLVRGTPFQDVRAGYAWVEFEHLAGEIDSVVADAALDLADLSLADGDLSAARFAVRQGLLGCPSSEPLLRAAMRVAHAAGERAGVERAWRDIERLAGEYGAEPEPESAALYQSLRRTAGPA